MDRVVSEIALAGSSGSVLARSVLQLVRRLLGVTLIVAASFKAAGLLAVTHSHTSVWLESSVAVGEALLGGLLVANMWSRVTWPLALTTFSAFAAFSWSAIFRGDSSCGCFGNAHVSPWITLGVDAMAIAALVWMGGGAPALATVTPGGRWAASPRAVPFLVIGLCAGWAISQVVAQTNHASDGLATVFEAREWIGKRLPFLDDIDIGDELSHGQWLVLLHRHDCFDCRDAVPQFEQVALSSATTFSTQRFAMLDVASHDATVRPFAAFVRSGKISKASSYSFETPACVSLYDGTVLRSQDWSEWHNWLQVD